MNMLDELKSIGISCTRIKNGVPVVSEADKPTALLIVAAHDKQDGTPEIAALKTELGADSEEWAAYVEARKAPIREERQKRYREETDPMRLKIDEDYTPGTLDWTDALEEWKMAKSQIRIDLPYPVE